VAPSVFISYRRDDAAPEAQLLSDAIRRLLGDDSVFMDVKSLRGGEQWPEVLKRSILAARVVVAVIGPEWARVADERGRRRITQKHDWVRLELATALNTANKLVIPVLVRNAKLPPDKVLPRDVRGLLQKNALEIRTTYFDHDVQLLTAQLKSVTSAVSGHSTRPSPYPRHPPEGPQPIPEADLTRLLDKELKEWSIIKSPLPENASATRTELYRHFEFENFQAAVAFMMQVAPGCDIAMHHPRWENIWTHLYVYLTTWDIDHRISDRDVQLARYFERAFSEFPGRARARVGPARRTATPPKRRADAPWRRSK